MSEVSALDVLEELKVMVADQAVAIAAANVRIRLLEAKLAEATGNLTV